MSRRQFISYAMPYSFVPMSRADRFTFHYGTSKIAELPPMTLEEAEALRDRYFAAFPELKAFSQSIAEPIPHRFTIR